MQVPRVVAAGLASGLWLSVALSAALLAQAPTTENQPRLAAPSRGAVLQPTSAPGVPTPIAQPPGQPTTATASDTAEAPAPTPLTAVSGPGSGITQLPNSTATAPTASSSQAATASYRSYGAARFSLALDGMQAGLVNGVEGGSPTTDVVVERVGPDNVIHKHVAGVKYEDLSFSTGLDSKPLSEWISGTLKGQHARKNGSVIASDYNYNAVSQVDFFNGQISGVTFPALDGSSKDAASLTVSIAPEYTRSRSASGKGGDFGVKSQKRWLRSNFRFEMDGLDGSRVAHIDSIPIGQPQIHDIGEQRDYEKLPSTLNIPNVKLTLSEASAGTWAAWLDDFLVKGNNSNDKERNGSIVYLDQTLKGELGRLNLFNCGIIRLAPQKTQAGSESIRRLQAELYCERMEFESKATTS
jgi:T4-like virus tail tube protein gp19